MDTAILGLEKLLWALTLSLLFASMLWLVSVRKENVAFVDVGWPIIFWFAAVLFFQANTEPRSVAWVGLAMISLWALRLTLHVLVRNAGRPEDRRYREIREKFNPGFRWKSLFVIFWFQAVLAWARPLGYV